MDSLKLLIDNEGEVLRVVPDTIDYLQKLRQRVVVVSVVGLYRTGKSYLLNKLAGKREGFALGNTIEAKTKGIWMWCVPHPQKADITLVLLDTEGLGDPNKGDSKNDSAIFSLAILLSSTLVFNSKGTIDNQALENIHFVTELTDLIKVSEVKSNGASSTDEEEEEECADSQFVQFFPNFVWTVRDFFLKLKINDKYVTADGYLEHSLELRKGHDKRTLLYNLPRECIRNYFPSRKCFVFPTPTSGDMSQLETLKDEDINPEFRRVTDAFCRYVLDESCVKKVKGGHELTGSMLGHLAQTYVEAIVKGAVPCLENAVVTMAKIENGSAVREGLDVYRKGMEQVTASFPVEMDVMYDRHHRSNELATEAFMSRSFKDENGDFFTTLKVDIAKLYAELLVKNEEASEERCSGLLKELHAPVVQKIQEGYFAKPGGYELYCIEHNALVAKYRAAPGKGVAAEEILDDFLRDTAVESKSILEADKKLSENERKIHEERERVVLAEQEMKVMKESQQQLEREKEERERSYKENIDHLKMKNERETEQQKLELARAMESKLEEMRRLQEKKLFQKEKVMKEEIDEMKKKMEDTKRQEETSSMYTSVLQGLGQGISDGMGHYFNYKQTKEQARVLKYRASRAKLRKPK